MMKISRVAMATITLAGMAGLSAAQPKADPKAPGADMSAMKMPTAPQALADMSKMMTGTWKCTGKSIGMDMKTMEDMTGTMKQKLEMDGFWMHSAFDAKMGKMPFHFDSYETVDAKNGWRRIMVSSGGEYSVGTSDGPKDNKIDWMIESHSSMGSGHGKDHIDWSDMKAGVKAMGEWSMDGGKTFNKIYEMICKK